MRAMMTLAAMALLATPAAALEAPKDYAGKYTLSGVSEGAEVCNLTLTDEGAIGGWALELAPDCQKKFGLPDDLAAWTVGPNGQVRFIDPLRKTRLIFEPSEIGGYVANQDEGEPISLDRDLGDQPEPTEQERMSGEWHLVRMGGEAICAYTMTSNAIGTKGTLKVKGACPAPWNKVNRWEIAKGRLMLIDTAGKMVVALPGDSIQGFDGSMPGEEFLGMVRQWGD